MRIVVIGLAQPNIADNLLLESFRKLRAELRVYKPNFIFQVVDPECFHFHRDGYILKGILAGSLAEEQEDAEAGQQPEGGVFYVYGMQGGVGFMEV